VRGNVFTDAVGHDGHLLHVEPPTTRVSFACPSPPPQHHEARVCPSAVSCAVVRVVCGGACAVCDVRSCVRLAAAAAVHGAGRCALIAGEQG
jgi:hypothetical protein